jgi:hypothetical protein
MSTNHQSFERFPTPVDCGSALWQACLCWRLRGAPDPRSFNILGSYFPSWLVCLGIAIGLTFLAHLLVTTKKLADQLWPLPIVYSALLCFFSCTLWLIFFE